MRRRWNFWGLCVGNDLQHFSGFQFSLHKSIQTVTENVESIETSTLVVTTTMKNLHEKVILERKIEELEMDCIADLLRIDGLESRIYDGADELRVGEVIIRSPQDLKSNMARLTVKEWILEVLFALTIPEPVLNRD